MSDSPVDLKNADAVVFDAVGTVMYPDPPVPEVYASAVKQFCGVELDTTHVARVFGTALADRSRQPDLRTDEQTERRFWADVIHQLCPNHDGFDACFEYLFEHFATPKNWRCFSDVEPALTELSRRDIKVAIASNFDSRLHRVCDGLPELRCVKTRIISSQAGFRKPAPQFFQAVCDRLDLPASQIVFAGDDLVNDVQGALAAGMQAVWVRRRPGPEHEDLPDNVCAVRSLTDLAAIPAC